MHAQDGRRWAAVAAGTAFALAVMSPAALAAIPAEPDPDVVAAAIVSDAATLDAAGTDWERLATVPPALPDDPFPAGVSVAPLGGFPTAPESFAVLSTGDVANVDAPDDSQSTGDSLAEEVPDGDGSDLTDNGAEFGNTDNDVTILRLAVTVPAGANCVSLDYRFLTEEYPEFVGNAYNDAFIAEIDTRAWSTNDDVISHTGDFATTPAGEPVSVDGVGGVAMTAAEAEGTTFDGATGRVTTKSPITPGPHDIYLSIFDQGDEIYDSAVLLDRLAFITESPATCKPPEVPVVVPPPPPPPGPPAPVPPPPPANDISVPGGSVTFRNGSATVTIQVPGPGTVTAGQAPAAGASRRAIASARRKKLIKPATAVATKAGPVKLKIKPTRKGKKRLRKRGKLKVSLAVTFTPTGGTPNTEITKLTIKKKKKR